MITNQIASYSSTMIVLIIRLLLHVECKENGVHVFFKCTIKTQWLRNKVLNDNHFNYVESLKNWKQNCRQKDRHVYCIMIKVGRTYRHGTSSCKHRESSPSLWLFHTTNLQHLDREVTRTDE